MGSEKELKLEATELRLGPPGMLEEREKQNPGLMIRSNKRPFISLHPNGDDVSNDKESDQQLHPSSKAQAQVVGWPPVRSCRKKCLQTNIKSTEAPEAAVYVKVSMDGAPYLRKIDLNLYKGYPQLLMALQDLFKFKLGVYCEKEGYDGSDYVPTYEDKDADWMLVGDVPWDMFTTSCKRLRIMRSSEAKGLACGDAGTRTDR